MPSKQYWLLKTEPSTYSFDTLLKVGKTNWNGVRNFQARNFLKQVQIGDLALIYHSGDVKAVVGEARVSRAAYADPDPERNDWVQIDLEKPVGLKRSVPLSELKSDAGLKDLPLIRHTRLSCMPVTQAEFELIRTKGKA